VLLQNRGYAEVLDTIVTSPSEIPSCLPPSLIHAFDQQR
jgi:hypothetical protein